MPRNIGSEQFNTMIRVRSLVFVQISLGLWLSTGPVRAHDNVHVVEPGETLSEIAVAYDTDVETLRSLNDLRDIDLVWVGLPLTLPLEASPDLSGLDLTAQYLAMQEARATNIRNDSYFEDFGEPMSRGCVNMRNADAEWLYEWAGPEGADIDRNGWVVINETNPGTLVVVHE